MQLLLLMIHALRSPAVVGMSSKAHHNGEGQFGSRQCYVLAICCLDLGKLDNGGGASVSLLCFIPW